MYTWEMCAIQQRRLVLSRTCEHEHEHEHYYKGQSSSPNGCVSDELERLENTKRWNRIVTRISTSKIRSAIETNCLQSRARAKVALKAPVSSGNERTRG